MIALYSTDDTIGTLVMASHNNTTLMMRDQEICPSLLPGTLAVRYFRYPGSLPVRYLSYPDTSISVRHSLYPDSISVSYFLYTDNISVRYFLYPGSLSVRYFLYPDSISVNSLFLFFKDPKSFGSQIFLSFLKL